MPLAPVPISCSQGTPSHSSGDPQHAGPGADTPCKIPRPLKRRRFACGLAGVSEAVAQPVAAEGRGWQGLELALAVSFALLETSDIVQATASCLVWRGVAECKTLWVLAAPRLGLAARIVKREEVSRRRSRGTVLRGVLLGETRRVVALRSVDLRGANAGLDDGLLPTVVREVALLRSLSRAGHPGIVRLIGAEVVGEHVHIVTEYAASSFLQWFSRPRSPQARLRVEIRDRFCQLLQAVAFLHSAGVFHRNITPPNVLLDLPLGTVKLCDFACGRALDSPVRPYSPEDPKLRPQSTREARRLWYRAPEFLLRQPVYGPAVDIWSVGALMAEAARGEPLFPSESEIDHLFRIFRFAGSPGPDHWPQAMTFPAFSARFPVYEAIDLRLAARAARGAEPAASRLRNALGKQRPDMLNFCLRCGLVLGINGVDLLASMMHLDPQLRCTADVALASTFLKRSPAMSGGALSAWSSAFSTLREDAASGGCWDPAQSCSQAAAANAGRPVSCSQTESESVDPGTPQTRVARGVARMQLSSPPASCQASAGEAARGREAAPRRSSPTSCTLWQAMLRLDASLREESPYERSIDLLCAADADVRAAVVNSLVQLAGEAQVGDTSLHLGVALFDEERLVCLGKDSMEPELAAAACLKVADAFDEQSQEYYQRERTATYYQAARHRWPMAALLEAEKRVVQSIGFRVHRPTVAWFLRTCASAGGRELVGAPGVVRLARFIADLSLLDVELQRYSAALRAQVVLLIALHAMTSPEIALRLWLPVQHATCGSNVRDLAAACLARTLHILHTKREQWASRGLHAVESRHPEAARQTLRRLRSLPDDLAEALLPADGVAAPLHGHRA